ncbi:MAG TPA: hypothetical protein VM537_30920, partial [Anaerolineae bacterium]|nr:hypothetical protein [Anaerolineae bacterium]
MQQLDAGYIAAFQRVTERLVSYYDDRIGVWEIWNEPDYSSTRLEPGVYGDLLTAAHDSVKGVDPGDRVVFGGLGSADGNAAAYLREFYAAWSAAHPAQPAPFDILGIHPYLSTLYRDGSGQLLRDPKDYLRYESPTIIAKFQDILAGSNPAGIDDGQKDIWATELGWNSARGAETCAAIRDQLVYRSEQAQFLRDGFDILLRETAWDDGAAGVSKVFWYQYRDTGVFLDCGGTGGGSGAAMGAPLLSPSWHGSALAQAQASLAPDGGQLVHWWFGLYDGAFVAKPAQVAFQAYVAPTATPTSTPSPTATQTPTVTPTSTPSATPTSTSTPTPSATATKTASFTPSSTPSSTPSATPASTPTPSATATETSTTTPSSTPSSTPSATPTSTPTPSATATETATVTPSSTPSSTPSATRTSTPTPSATATETATVTPSSTPSSTPSATPSGTPTPTATATPTVTVTPSSTPSSTPTSTPTPSATATETPTATP